MNDLNNINYCFKSTDGSISMWIEQESTIHLKAVTSFNDPVELTADEARNLVELLIKFLAVIEDLDSV